jgi:hypothetical protein
MSINKVVVSEKGEPEDIRKGRFGPSISLMNLSSGRLIPGQPQTKNNRAPADPTTKICRYFELLRTHCGSSCVLLITI